MTSSRVKFSGYVVRPTLDYIMYCVLFSSSARVRFRFSVWLVCGRANAFVLLSVVIVSFPRKYVTHCELDGIRWCTQPVLWRYFVLFIHLFVH